MQETHQPGHSKELHHQLRKPLRLPEWLRLQLPEWLRLHD